MNRYEIALFEKHIKEECPNGNHTWIEDGGGRICPKGIDGCSPVVYKCQWCNEESDYSCKDCNLFPDPLNLAYRKALKELIEGVPMHIYENTEANNCAICGKFASDTIHRWNGGILCDTQQGPCACGAWHSEEMDRDPASANDCKGSYHCTDRRFDSSQKDCQECSHDYDKAISGL